MTLYGLIAVMWIHGFLTSAQAVNGDPRLLYVAGRRKMLLEHPYASPLRGDLHGLCSVLLQVGGAELLVDHATAVC